MEDFIVQIQQFSTEHIQYAPYIIFITLIMAGFNVPVSEDAWLFFSGVLASNRPEYTTQLFMAVYLGAYLSDLICYGLGRKFGPRILEIPFFSKIASAERIAKIAKFFHRYGMLTLVVGRFIPFGVRNGLFLTAGITRMKFAKFALSDFIACTISTSVLFYLYYQFGSSIVEIVKKFNIVFFSLAIIGIIVWYFLSYKKNHTPIINK